ncbi:T9SS type A sorting domain-containing protein [candidate division KSB1 bacterium]|nr:T9SS type A sorting domain-containing protein [candidate division KSB1 bacterium]
MFNSAIMRRTLLLGILFFSASLFGQSLQLTRELFLSAAGSGENSMIRLQSQFGITHFGAMKSRHFIIGPTIVVKLDSGAVSLPNSFQLLQNFPNPFNSSTFIEFWIAKAGFVQLKVYSVLGRHRATLVSKYLTNGKYRIQYSGIDDSGEPLSSGVYFCKLDADNLNKTIKLIIVR